MEHFDFSKLERKVFPTEEEKTKRASGFDYAIASPAFEGCSSPFFSSLREAYIEGYLTVDGVSALVDNHVASIKNP